MFSGQRPALMAGGHCVAFLASWASRLPLPAPVGLGLLPVRPPSTSDPTSHRATLPPFRVPCMGTPHAKPDKLYSFNTHSILYVHGTTVEQFLIKILKRRKR